MNNSISNHCALLAAGWVFLPRSRSIFPTTIPTTIPTTTPTICVKTTRARRKSGQVSEMRPAIRPAAGGPVLKSLIPSAQKFDSERPKVWFRVLKSLDRGLILPFAVGVDQLIEVSRVGRVFEAHHAVARAWWASQS